MITIKVQEKIKIGLICVGLEGERLDLATKFHKDAIKAIENKGLKIINRTSPYTLSGEEVKAQSLFCQEQGAVAIIYMTGTWVLANHIIDAVKHKYTYWCMGVT